MKKIKVILIILLTLLIFRIIDHILLSSLTYMELKSNENKKLCNIEYKGLWLGKRNNENLTKNKLFVWFDLKYPVILKIVGDNSCNYNNPWFLKNTVNKSTNQFIFISKRNQIICDGGPPLTITTFGLKYIFNRNLLNGWEGNIQFTSNLKYIFVIYFWLPILIIVISKRFIKGNLLNLGYLYYFEMLFLFPLDLLTQGLMIVFKPLNKIVNPSVLLIVFFLVLLLFSIFIIKKLFLGFGAIRKEKITEMQIIILAFLFLTPAVWIL